MRFNVDKIQEVHNSTSVTASAPEHEKYSVEGHHSLQGNGERILRDTAGDLYRGAALQGLRDHPAPQPSQRGPGTQPGRLPLHRTGPGSREAYGSPAFRPYHYRR